MTFKTNKQPVLYAFCGLPGAGKSTAARKLEKSAGAIRLNVDEWVASLGVDFWDDAFRHKLDRRLYAHGLTLLEHGQSIILEDGTWSRDERDELRKVARKLGATIEIHFFDVPFEDLWRRLEGRNAIGAPDTVPMTQELLKECWQMFEQADKAELDLFDRYIMHT